MLKMKEEDSVKENSSKLLEGVNKIRLLGEEFTDHMIFEKMLISLPPKFEAKVQKHRTKMRDDEVVEGAFFAKHKGKQGSGSGKKNYANRGRKQKNAKNNKKRDKFPLCSICQWKNHLEKEYRAVKPVAGKPLEDKEEPSESLFTVSQGSCSYDGGVWVIDNGCTSHMCKEEKVLCDLYKSVQIIVTLGNDDYTKMTWVNFLSQKSQVVCIFEEFKAMVELQSGCQAVGNMTLIETWNGVNPSTQHLKISCCACYVHVPAIRRRKLNAKAQLGIFLGLAHFGALKQGYTASNVAALFTEIVVKLQGFLKVVITDRNPISLAIFGTNCSNLVGLNYAASLPS
ncbi:Retrovirus-related Pol polyprotein from transposon TNT 1-94 [Senna tora]|uniref:Retrovirus-related Pol polyprotein from transposon TNT 1-94 n=1 Tax=Senna tora TaxID=362788 RepID=A0A834T3B6_9FABA|nr:Retrovirus-related Pol polyprotein from transposon TNT 1-94 [Senna tora]